MSGWATNTLPCPCLCKILLMGAGFVLIRNQQSTVGKLIWMFWTSSDYLVHCAEGGQVKSALWRPSNIKGRPIELA